MSAEDTKTILLPGRGYKRWNLFLLLLLLLRLLPFLTLYSFSVLSSCLLFLFSSSSPFLLLFLLPLLLFLGFLLFLLLLPFFLPFLSSFFSSSSFLLLLLLLLLKQRNRSCSSQNEIIRKTLWAVMKKVMPYFLVYFKKLEGCVTQLFCARVCVCVPPPPPQSHSHLKPDLLNQHLWYMRAFGWEKITTILCGIIA